MDLSVYPHLSEEDQRCVLAMAAAMGEAVTVQILATPPEMHLPIVRGFHTFVAAQVESERLKALGEASARVDELQGKLDQAIAAKESLAHRAQERDARVQGLKQELDALREQGTLHVEALEKQLALARDAVTALTQASATSPSQALAHKKKAVRLDVPKFDGNEPQRLVHWELALERAAKAQLIEDEDQIVSLALSHLRGKAQEWAYSALLADASAFPTWGEFKARIREVYQPPNHEVVLQSRFFASRQGKRTLLQYVQDMRTLAASITKDPLSETVKVPAFVNGLNRGPARQQLFRRMPGSMEEAIRIALVEEQSFNAAGQTAPPTHQRPFTHGGNRPAPPRGGGPEPMDLSVMDIICHACGKKGHIASRCFARNKKGHGAAAGKRRGRTFFPRGNDGRQGPRPQAQANAAQAAKGRAPQQGNGSPQ